MIGLLRDRMKIQRRQTVDGPLGPEETWVDVGERWARVVRLSVEARAQYQQVQSVVSHRVLMRGPLEIDLGNTRLVWRGKTLIPVEPPTDPDGLGRWVSVAVREE